jgi:hypothetical protein
MRRKERNRATTAYRHEVDDYGRHLCDVRIFTDKRGKVVDYTVLYLATIEDRILPVVRYDSAHGYPHRDTLDWDGHVVDKHWTPLQPLPIALNQAIEEVKTHWHEYFEAFLLRRPIR